MPFVANGEELEYAHNFSFFRLRRRGLKKNNWSVVSVSHHRDGEFSITQEKNAKKFRPKDDRAAAISLDFFMEIKSNLL